MTITINGSGTIDGISAGGLPDSTITQAELSSNVAGNGPAFSAYQSILQTISANTLTKLTFTTEEYDTNNNFASSRFTPTVAGYYYISAAVQTYGTVANSYLAVMANGSVYKYGSQVSSQTNPQVLGNALVYLNGSTDYVEIHVFTSTGGNTVNSRGQTWVQGFLARAA